MNLSTLWDALGTFIALATIPGTLELFVLTAASLFWKSTPAPEPPAALNLAVVVPAHNEEANIQKCLRSLLACAPGAHRVQPIVVADNCTDQTGPKAVQMGVRVFTRTNLEKRGKGYALSDVFLQLLTEPFDAVIVLDADTLVEENFIRCFAARFSRGANAVQCRYLPASPDASVRSRLMNLALIAFHVIRPRGRNRLGFSSGIFGNGFGLSRYALESVPYHPGSITEDLEYHISLVRQGIPVVFEDTTTVRALFPEDEHTASIQRSRWEGGRFRLMITCIPDLLKDVFRGKHACLEALFDLLTLPLGFHVFLLMAAVIASSGWGRYYAYGALGIVCFHVTSAIMTAGSRQDALALFAAPFYIFWKMVRLPFIINATRKNTRWVRTPRQKEQKEKTP